MVKKIDKFMSVVTSSICYVSYAAIIFIMILTVIDVLLRRIMSTGIVGTYELVERSLLILVFGAFAYTQVTKGHVHVTLFLGKFPKPVGLFIFGVFGLMSTGASAFCAWAIVVQGNTYATPPWERTAVLLIPHFPFYYVAAACMLVFTVALLWDAIKSFIGIANAEVSEEIRSHWE